MYDRNIYKSWSTCIHLTDMNKDKFDQRKANNSEHIKVYNKTLHPLFACSSVKQTIGMGASPFFHGSAYYFNKNCEAKDTSRLRVEHSRFFKSITEEQSFLLDDDSSDKCDEVCEILNDNAEHFVRQIPFGDVWEAFWGSVKEHFFMFE